MPRVRRLFPDAKILVLYRDGRDVAQSLTRVPWMSANLYVNFVVWLYYQWVVRKERQGAFPDVYGWEWYVRHGERGVDQPGHGQRGSDRR